VEQLRTTRKLEMSTNNVAIGEAMKTPVPTICSKTSMMAGRTSETRNFAITRISITLALCSLFEQLFFLFLPSSSEVGAQRAFLFTTACLNAMEILNVNPKRSKHGTKVTNNIAKMIWYTVQ